jgi:hypothetical protein
MRMTQAGINQDETAGRLFYHETANRQFVHRAAGREQRRIFGAARLGMKILRRGPEQSVGERQDPVLSQNLTVAAPRRSSNPSLRSRLRSLSVPWSRYARRSESCSSEWAPRRRSPRMRPTVS